MYTIYDFPRILVSYKYMKKLTMVNFIYLFMKRDKIIIFSAILCGSHHVESRRFYSIILDTYMILYLLYKSILLGMVFTNQ